VTARFFDICKGAIPGSRQLIPYPSLLTCAAVGGVAVISPFAKRLFNRFASRPIHSWHVYRRLPALPPLSSRQIAIGGTTLFLSICVIGAFYPYLRLFLSSPYPTSFSLRFRQISPHTITAVMGVVICIGTKITTTCFGVHIIPNALNQLQIQLFGLKKKTIDSNVLPISVEASVVEWGRGCDTVPKSDSIPPSSPNEKPDESKPISADNSGPKLMGDNRNDIVTVAPSLSHSRRGPLLPEIFQVCIFPLVINNTRNFKEFFTIGSVCKAWRKLLLDPNCLVPPSPHRHFLWRAFHDLQFDPIEVIAFFQAYLPKDHQGIKLRLPFRFLHYHPSLTNSITSSQLAYILHQFPKASIDALTLRLGDEDDVADVASLLNNCLEPDRKMYSLTIVPDRLSNHQESESYGKLLSGEQHTAKYGFMRQWEQTEYQKNYSAQVMKLLPLLKGRVSFLRIDFSHAKEDNDLDPVQIVPLFESSKGLVVDRLDLGYDWKLQCPPHKDREKIEGMIKNEWSHVNWLLPEPEESLIDKTLVMQEVLSKSKDITVNKCSSLS
jgi:hypothetical protein